jgi:hypothetical protein
MNTPPESPHDHVERGSCRWCGEDVLKRSGKINFKENWHKDCRDEMELVYDDDLMRKHIWKRDKGHCAECSQIFGLKGWEVSYIILPSDEPNNLDLWKPANIETLCWQCWKTWQDQR